MKFSTLAIPAFVALLATVAAMPSSTSPECLFKREELVGCGAVCTASSDCKTPCPIFEGSRVCLLFPSHFPRFASYKSSLLGDELCELTPTVWIP